jgi:rfaE bifunctional protein kinase chain/domain
MSIEEILAEIPKLSALVVGDICLDRWCTYDPALSEPSRETGIPRLGVVYTEVTPGAGGTVANNLAALGTGRVAVAGVIGDDGFAVELGRALEARGILSNLLVKDSEVTTFTYTKLINRDSGVEDQSRVDFINVQPLPVSTENKLLERLRHFIPFFDVIFVSDQAETEHGGVITENVRRLLGELAGQYPEKIFLADSRMRIEQFRGVLCKANQHEAETACQKLFARVDYQSLLRHMGGRLMMVTHGAEGVLVVEPTRVTWVKAVRVEKPVDICGAGDSFSAGAGLALAAGASPLEAAQFGNLVASITIMKKGTGTASPEEVRTAALEVGM